MRSVRIGQRGLDAECLGVERGEQESRGDIGIRRVAFDAGAGGEDERVVDLPLADAVEEARDRLIEDRGSEALTEARAGILDALPERVVLQFRRAAVRPRVGEDARPPLLRPRLAVEDVAPRHTVLPGAHQRFLDLVLNLLDAYLLLLVAPDDDTGGEIGDLRRRFRRERDVRREVEFGPKRLLDGDADALAVERGGRAVPLGDGRQGPVAVGLRGA